VVSGGGGNMWDQAAALAAALVAVLATAASGRENWGRGGGLSLSVAVAWAHGEQGGHALGRVDYLEHRISGQNVRPKWVYDGQLWTPLSFLCRPTGPIPLSDTFERVLSVRVSRWRCPNRGVQTDECT
jgi:hypothetical protein